MPPGSTPDVVKDPAVAPATGNGTGGGNGVITLMRCGYPYQLYTLS